MKVNHASLQNSKRKYESKSPLAVSQKTILPPIAIDRGERDGERDGESLPMMRGGGGLSVVAIV